MPARRANSHVHDAKAETAADACDTPGLGVTEPSKTAVQEPEEVQRPEEPKTNANRESR